jgi:hypothetical protein
MRVIVVSLSDVFRATEIALSHPAATRHLVTALRLLEGQIAARALADHSLGKALLPKIKLPCCPVRRFLTWTSSRDRPPPRTCVPYDRDSSPLRSICTTKVHRLNKRYIPTKLGVAVITIEHLVHFLGHVHDEHIVAVLTSEVEYVKARF